MSTKTYELSTGMELLETANSDLVNVLQDIRTEVATLDSLAAQIKDAAYQTIKSANNAVEGALITGALLIEAKKQVPHGEWEQWLLNNCDVAVRTAQKYMRLASKFTATQPKAHADTFLTMKDAFSAISADPTAPPKPAYRSTYNPKLSDRQKTEALFGKAVSALKASTRLVSIGLKEKQVSDLRKKLNDVLAELDSMEAVAKLEGGAE